MNRKTVVGSFLVLALVLVGICGSTVFAATNSSNNGLDKMKETSQAFITKLAANLGVDETTLETALETTQAEILAEQVAAGTITQDQADKITAQGVNLGTCLGGPGGGHGPGAGGPPPGGAPPSDSTSSNSGS